MLNEDLPANEFMKLVFIVDDSGIDLFDPTEYNEVIYFKCQEGFKLEGPEKSVCQKDGLFHLDDELPKCKGIFINFSFILKYFKLLAKV